MATFTALSRQLNRNMNFSTLRRCSRPETTRRSAGTDKVIGRQRAPAAEHK
jgi:hypothetical protein